MVQLCRSSGSRSLITSKESDGSMTMTEILVISDVAAARACRHTERSSVKTFHRVHSIRSWGTRLNVSMSGEWSSGCASPMNSASSDIPAVHHVVRTSSRDSTRDWVSARINVRAHPGAERIQEEELVQSSIEINHWSHTVSNVGIDVANLIADDRLPMRSLFR